jgi:hypothetical protein
MGAAAWTRANSSGGEEVALATLKQSPVRSVLWDEFSVAVSLEKYLHLFV